MPPSFRPPEPDRGSGPSGTPTAVSLHPERLTEIRRDPRNATERFSHPGIGRLVLRPLAADDAEAFGRYLEALGPESRRRFGPHPHTMAEARRLCGELDRSEALRLLVLREGEAEAVGYFILYPGVRPAEEKRYAGYGIALQGETDCTFAPSIADVCQGQGLGSAVMAHILDLVRALGFSRVVLSGGTQATNDRAIGYYEKFGFRRVGSFETDSATHGRLNNHDMMMILPAV